MFSIGKRLARRRGVARVWANEELRRLAPHLGGDVVNVSGAADSDKHGAHYRDYFTAASSYTITNYPDEAWQHSQGNEGEIPLDLTAELPAELHERFDVVLSHTTLEHIYEVQAAFANLCRMTRDIVIVIVPFVHEMHGPDDNSDYWRFTPLTIKRMFEDNGLTNIYSSFNSQPGLPVYVFAIGSKHPERWDAIARPFTCTDPNPALGGLRTGLIGCHAVQQGWQDRLYWWLVRRAERRAR